MTKKLLDIKSKIKEHRCYTHPVFDHWIITKPSPSAVGAFFHQLQRFCAATRPGWNFPEALTELDMLIEGQYLQEIVDSEVDHGRALAKMAGFIVNCAANHVVFKELDNQIFIERALKKYSDQVLGALPGYAQGSGLTSQTRRAMSIFDRRKLQDRESTLLNLGSTLALEMISNNHLIPGEKRCLIDSNLYGTTMESPEMYYIVQHWGDLGAEHEHERKISAAVESVLNAEPILNMETSKLIEAGAIELLEALADLWDLLDTELLRAGNVTASTIAEKRYIAL